MMGTSAACFNPHSVQSFTPQANYQMPVYQSNAQTQKQEEIDDGVKYTCRYDIQIDNEKEFQVARRVIGSKGANMKRII
jgi:hypothetical protein